MKFLDALGRIHAAVTDPSWGDWARAYPTPPAATAPTFDPYPKSWCAGCDQVRLASSMKFTESGLYRCRVCRIS